MARTAEMIWAGDASSLISAAERAEAATVGSTERMRAATAKWSASATAAGDVAAKTAAKIGASAEAQASAAGAAAAKQAEAAGASARAQAIAYGKAADAAKAAAIRTQAANEETSHSFKGVGLAATAAAGLVVLGIKKSANTTAELAKETLTLHNVTGLSVKSASTYAAVAQAQGLNVKQLNQAFGTLSKNVHAVENAHAGLTKAAKTQENAFKQLGLPISAIIKAHGDLNKLMPQIIDRFEHLPGSVNKAALGMALFGRGWQSLVPLMHSGELGLKEQMKTAERMGATLQGHSVKSLKDFQKAQEEAKYGSLGLQLAIGQYLAPALTKLIGTGVKVVHSLGEGVHWLEKHKEAASILAHVIGVVLGGALTVFAVNKVKKFVDSTKEAIGAVKTLASRVAGSSASIEGSVAGQAAAAKTAAGEISASSASMEGSFAGQATAAETAAGKTAAAQNGLAADVAAADAKIEASNAAAAGSFTGVLSKLALLGGAIAVGGAAFSEQGMESDLERQVAKEHPDKPTMFGHKNPYYKAGTGNGLTGENMLAAGGVPRVGTLGASNQYPYISSVAQRFGLSPNTLWGVYGTETSYGKNISTSSAGAMGAFQFIPETAKAYGYPETNHPNQRQFEAQTEAAARYLSVLIRKNHGNVEAALADYSGHTPGYTQKVASNAHGGASAGTTKAAKVKAALELAPQHIVNWAEKAVGHFAESWGNNTGPELDKLQAEFHTRAAAWCAEFATTAAMMGGANRAVRTASVATIREWAQAGSHGYRKGLHATGAKPGDLMLFGDQHVGFVQSVHGGTVTTIEGNTGAGKVARVTRHYGEGEFATPTYPRGATGAGELAEIGKRLAKIEGLVLSPAQRALVHGFTGQASAAHAESAMYGGYASQAGESWQRARSLQVQRSKPLGTAQGNRDATLIDTQDVLTAKAQKVYYTRELAALGREVKAWQGLRASYLKFARHAVGHAKKEALDKAAVYAGKIREAQAQAKELHGTIADTETAIETAQNVLGSTLPAEIGAADLSTYQAANAKVDAEVRAGILTEAQGKAAKESNARNALAGGFGSLSEEGVLQVKGDLREFAEATTAATDALKQHTEALEASAKALHEFATVASSIGAVEAGSLAKSLADTVSGQIAGIDYHGQKMTAGVGTAARY